jgi:fused signal recognition particle receptor
VTFVILGIVLAVLIVGGFAGFVLTSRRGAKGEAPAAPKPAARPVARPADASPAPATPTEAAPPIAATPPVEAAPPVDAAPTAPAEPALEMPPPSAGRLVRLRGRLAGSQSTLGRGLLALLSRDTIDDDAWDEVEDTLLIADVGVATSREIVDRLRERVRVLGTRSPEAVRDLLREELLDAIGRHQDRSLHTAPHDGY